MTAIDPMLEVWTLQFQEVALEKAFCHAYNQEVLAPGDRTRAYIHLLGTLCYHALAFK